MPDYRGLDIASAPFGAVSLDDLFCDNEQVVFDFYARNKSRYTHAADIGANVGVHSILMAQQGWIVKAYEPDPTHTFWLSRNLLANNVCVYIEQAAVSDFCGEVQFVRVKNNTTGNHILGMKSPYGPLETITVRVVHARKALANAQFAKIDAEGAEVGIVAHLPDTCEAMVEVGSPAAAAAIYESCLHRELWRIGEKEIWRAVQRIDDMPTHHSHGPLFIGSVGAL